MLSCLLKETRQRRKTLFCCLVSFQAITRQRKLFCCRISFNVRHLAVAHTGLYANTHLLRHNAKCQNICSNTHTHIITHTLDYTQIHIFYDTIRHNLAVVFLRQMRRQISQTKIKKRKDKDKKKKNFVLLSYFFAVLFPSLSVLFSHISLLSRSNVRILIST